MAKFDFHFQGTFPLSQHFFGQFGCCEKGYHRCMSLFGRELKIILSSGYNDVDDLKLVTIFICSRPILVKRMLVIKAVKVSPRSESFHQHISSLRSVTNIDLESDHLVVTLKNIVLRKRKETVFQIELKNNSNRIECNFGVRNHFITQVTNCIIQPDFLLALNSSFHH